MANNVGVLLQAAPASTVPHLTCPANLWSLQTQRSRLSGYTGMTNGNHSTQSSFGTLFGAPLSSSSPWGNNATTSFANNRDTITPRGPLTQEALLRVGGTGADGPADAINGGASALRGTSTNGAWRAWGAAADSSQARPLSGNTSPRSRSDASSHDMNGGSIFFSAGPSTVTQGAASGSRPATTTTSALEPSSGTFQHHSGFADYADEGDDEQFMTQELDRGFPTFATAAQRQAQDPSALNAVGTGAARRSLSSRGQSDLTFSDFPYGASAGPSNHSQRPSLAGSSFPTQNAMNFDHNAGRQSNAGLVGDAFARMALNDNSNGAASGLGSGPSYGNGAQNFQFNPVTQPWDAGQGYGNGFARDTYGNGMGHEHRGSIVGRNSPAGSTYLAGNGLNSPRSFTGTPQPSADAWPTPASRDPRLALELERRGLVSPFVQQAPNAYFPNAFFPQNYTQFPYGAYGDPRNPAHMAGYGMPIPPYALGGAIPTRPARDQDPGRAYRSALLQEFKNSPKSRRWELKVGSYRCLITTLSWVN
jgi:mRNA-binding protein PUF3